MNFLLKELALLFFILNILFCNNINFKGDSWISISYSDTGSSLTSEFAYIPHLSSAIKLSSDESLDFEFSERFMYASDKSYSITPYRSWIRYATSYMEIRIGLQKISFGPAQILRSIAWFDNISIENPIATTDGVDALRVKNYMSDSFSSWFWLIQDDYSKISLGGRAEISTKVADIGLTLHRDEVEQSHAIGQFPISAENPNSRIGVDVRYDGIIGLWNETATVIEDQADIHTFITIGLDYTLPYFQGLHFLLEHLSYHRYSDDSVDTVDNVDKNINMSSFMAGIPIGIFNNLMLITNIDWDSSKLNYFIRWSSSFDDFSVNLMSSINSETDIGNNFKIMLAYNH